MTDANPLLLPAAYTSFLPVIERLSEPLQAIVAGLLAQFESLVGAVNEPALNSRGEVEGLGGLTTHGEVSHILQSELLLRTEVPLEFLRRMAEVETLYLERQYQDEGIQRVYRLMVSVGPGLLGHGRTLALAALFFMARVARDRGDLFHWCFMPAGNGAIWFDDMSINTIKRFLKAASYREMVMDDLVEARAAWDQMHPRPKGHAKPVWIDWAIGARAPVAPTHAGPAVHQAPHAIGFSLGPPVPGAARTATLTLRHRGRERRPVAFAFPPDAVCLSALNRPFAPIKPEGAAATEVVKRGKLNHWEPLYFTAPNATTRIVRMAAGLLILIAEKKHDFSRRYFVPIAEDARLVGVRLNKNILSMLIQDQPGGHERLVHFSGPMAADTVTSRRSVARAKSVPCAHLFRKQPAFAVPLLAGSDRQVLFYAANGKAFSLNFDADGDSARFDANMTSPQILHSDGRYRIVMGREGDRDDQRLRVLHGNGSALAGFDGAIDRDRLFGMVYSSSHGRLAYSAAPHVWTVPSFSAGTETASEQFEVASYETPLTAREHGGFVEATLWSDARLGGDGTIRSVQFRGKEVLSMHKTFTLDDDAICDVKMTDDGLWALAADQGGAPSRLHCYHREKKDRKPARTAFDLNELMADAAEIDILAMIDG